jgi:primase-polymerase (primpol)-like protein
MVQISETDGCRQAAAAKNDLDSIPAELRERDRWALWRGEVVETLDDNDKVRKVPVNPRTGRNAASTRPGTWTSFEEARKVLECDQAAFGQAQGRYNGLMFALTLEDGFVGIDLDGCRDPQTGVIADWAEPIIKHLDSYTEASPSGTGVHVWVKGKKPGGRCRVHKIEVYSEKRFLCTTGKVLAGWGTGRIENRQEELNQMYAQHLAGRPTAISQTTPERAVPAVPAVPVPEEKLAELLKDPAAALIYRGEQDG